MDTIKCTLISQSIGIHVQELYTWFGMLAREGLIGLDQRIHKRGSRDHAKVHHLRNRSETHLTVVMDDNIRLTYDVNDSFEIDEARLSESDFYFKRSYSPESLRQYENDVKARVLPLGLNYKVYPNGLDKLGIARSLFLGSTRQKIYNGYASLNVCNWITFIPRVDNMWSVPCYEADPRILCMLRVYDPNNQPDKASDKVEQKHQLNEARANFIKCLRKEFGSRFTGGLMHTELAVD